MNDYEDFDALALAALVRRGQVSAAELLDAALRRAEARDPALNAVVTRLDDAARAALAAGAADGPVRRRAVPRQGPARGRRRCGDDERVAALRRRRRAATPSSSRATAAPVW